MSTKPITRSWLLCMATVQLLYPVTLPPSNDYVEGEVIVRWHPSTTRPLITATAAAKNLQIKREFRLLGTFANTPWTVISSTNHRTTQLIQMLSTNEAVASVIPNHLRQIDQARIRIPIDTFFTQQWALENIGQPVNGTSGYTGADIRFRHAWALARDIVTNAPIVGVIDTGVDRLHPDLASNIWENPNEIPFNGLDDDHNGYVDDVWGYDFVNDDWDSSDIGDHGTHISGIVAATIDNATGIAGACYRAKILPLKVSADGMFMRVDAIVAAIEYATMMKLRGANIVALNCSYSGTSSNEAEFAAIQLAGQAGIIICAAAGNEGANIDSAPVYPAGYPATNIITVTATDQNDLFPLFANYGTNTVKIAAPGVDILSTIPLEAGDIQCNVITSTTNISGEHFQYAGISPGITGIIYHCKLGYPADFPPEVSNNIALIQRGQIYFSAKVANAMAAGAKAVIIYNNTSGLINGTLQYKSNWIPVIGISMNHGLMLSNLCPIPGVVLAWPNPSTIYEFNSGTSMAAPFVAAAVAFAALNFPEEALPQRINRILSAVDTLESLHDKMATRGRLNLAKIVDTDSNGLPDWWEKTYFSAIGANPSDDPDTDGLSNLAEWYAGTIPTNKNSAFRMNIDRGTANLLLRWPAIPRRNYTLLASSLTNHLESGFAPILWNLTGSNEITIPIEAGAQNQFYRVKIESMFDP